MDFKDSGLCGRGVGEVDQGAGGRVLGGEGESGAQRGHTAGRDLCHLGVRQRGEPAVVAPQAFQRRVVQEDRYTVGGQPYVDLDRVGACFERGAERGQGVLAVVVRGAAVTDDRDAAGGGRRGGRAGRRRLRRRRGRGAARGPHRSHAAV